MNLRKYVPRLTPIQWVLLTALAGVVVYYTYKDYKLNQDLEESGSYTIGKLYDIDTTGTKGGDEYIISVKYKVSKQEYEIGERIWSGAGYDYSIGDSVFVYFLPKEPTRSKILLDNPVPKKIGKIPPKGWAELPKGAQE